MLFAAIIIVNSSFVAYGEQVKTEIYVSKDGNDSGDGSKQNPLATIAGARDMIRKMKNEKGLPRGNVYVYVGNGEYFTENSIEFDSRDSGTADSQIIYKNSGDGQASILGGIKLKGFNKISDKEQLSRLKENVRDFVYCVELSDYGINKVDDYDCIGMGIRTLDYGSVQVYYNGNKLQIAKYPNEGYLKTGTVLDGGTWNAVTEDPNDESKRSPVFKYDYSGVKQWKDYYDIWITGYLQYDWADIMAKVKSFDLKNSSLELAHSVPYSVAEDRKFCFVNVFEELDTPGEYYIDRKTNILYIYPPGDIQTADVELALLKDPLIKINDASYIKFEGLNFGLDRANVFELDNCNAITVDSCDISQNVKDAIMAYDCTNCNFVNNKIYNMGARGIFIKKRDLGDIVMCNNKVINNEIHDYQQIETTYRAGISIQSIGDYAGHNEVYNATHYALNFAGNYNVFEYNDIHDVLLMADDSGTTYTGRSWLNSRNTFRYNYYHDIPNGTGTWHTQGIYFDDMLFGNEVYGNVFEGVQNAVFLHGGRNTEIHDNIFINCENSVYIKHYAGLCGPEGHMYKKIIPEVQERVLKYPEWGKEFSEIVAAINDDPEEPKYNKIYNNLMYNTPLPLLDATASPTAVVENNYITVDSKIFSDYDNGDYTVKTNSVVFSKIPDFKGASVKDIGLLDEKYLCE